MRRAERNLANTNVTVPFDAYVGNVKAAASLLVLFVVPAILGIQDDFRQRRLHRHALRKQAV